MFRRMLKVVNRLAPLHSWEIDHQLPLKHQDPHIWGEVSHPLHQWVDQCPRCPLRVAPRLRSRHKCSSRVLHTPQCQWGASNSRPLHIPLDLDFLSNNRLQEVSLEFFFNFVTLPVNVSSLQWACLLGCLHSHPPGGHLLDRPLELPPLLHPCR